MKKIIFLLTLLIIPLNFAAAQDLKSEIVLNLDMLEKIKNDIQENYYDPSFHGINIEENYIKTRELIKKASSAIEMTDLIARFCFLLDDSHVGFIPPRKTFSVDYGWELLLIDGKVFVTKIKDDSDAYKKGIRIGDQIYMIEGFIPNRREYSILMRHFNVLQPQPSLNVLIIKPNGNKYKLDFTAKITEASRFMLSRRDQEIKNQKYESENYTPDFYDKIPGLAVLKMPTFNLSIIKVNKMMEKVRESENLILDLRGNRGGYHDALEQLLKHFFEREVDAGKIIRRDGARSFLIKPTIKKTYKGQLIVLVDSSSASAAEMFARIIQLEKRGTVIGDQSAGAVMQSIYLTHAFGIKSYVFYGISITIADIVMKDGQRLEKTGVTPDEKIIPSAADLIKNRDPVLSRAAQILGYKLTPEEAGVIFDKDSN